MSRRRLFKLGAREIGTERELDAEIAAHMELRVAQLMEQGMPEERARAEALRRFGPPETARHDMHRAAVSRDRRLGWQEHLRDLLSDVSFSWRAIWRDRRVCVVIVFTLAMGLGTNALMFGVVDRLLLAGPRYVEEPGQLQKIYRQTTNESGEPGVSAWSSYASFLQFRDHARSFSDVAAYDANQLPLGTGADVELARVGSASANLFDLIPAKPHIGRFFTTAEDQPPRGSDVAVLSHELWQRRFAGSDAVLGTTIVLNGDPYTVVGVAPPGLTGVELGRQDVWVPLARRSRHMGTGWAGNWDSRWIQIVGRLAPGATPEAAASELTGMYRAAFDAGLTGDAKVTVLAAPIRYDDRGRQSLEATASTWLFALSAIVLLIACANVTNLQIARAIARRREIAIRLALGVTRLRLVRLVLTESLMLAVGAGLLSLLVLYWGSTAVQRVFLPTVEWGSGIPQQALLWCAAITAGTGLLIGVLPALSAMRQQPVNGLALGVRGGGGRSAMLPSLLTAVQAALSVILLIGAGLVVRSLVAVTSMDLGFDAPRVVAISVPRPSTDEMQPEERKLEWTRADAYDRAATERLQQLPGVERVSRASWIPLYASYTAQLRTEQLDSVTDAVAGGPYVTAAGPGYFETMGTSLVAGRVFTDADLAAVAPVSVINRTMSQRLWPDRSPIGECLFIGAGSVPCARVVGVVEDSRRFELREAASMQYYVPLGFERQIYGRSHLTKALGTDGPTLLVRTDREPEALTREIRRELAAVYPYTGYIEIATLADALDSQVRPWRLAATLFAALGALALLIAATGLYSAIAFAVASQKRSLAVRRALGADQRNLAGLVMRRGLGMAGAGIAVGVAVALLLYQKIEALLFDVSPGDPVIIGSVVLAMLAAAALACLMPAVAAARVEPGIALSSE